MIYLFCNGISWYFSVQKWVYLHKKSRLRIWLVLSGGESGYADGCNAHLVALPKLPPTAPKKPFFFNYCHFAQFCAERLKHLGNWW